MNFTVLGPGRWGSCIAWYLNKIGKNVTLWGLDTDSNIHTLIDTHKNEYVEFPDDMKFSTNLQEAIDFADFIIISISSQNIRSLLKNICAQKNYENKKFILCMKGIENGTGNRLSLVLMEFGIDKMNIATWVGPGHVQSLTKGVPGVMIIDAYDKNLSELLVRNVSSDLIKFYQGQDMIGTEIGAAAKNVVGIAAGLLDGMGFSSLKGALMTRATHEISLLIEACGGNKLSAYGLCHLGDYEATLFSPFSHNRMFGEKFAKGESFEKLAEGVATSSALLTLAEKYSIELPITFMVNSVIFNKISKEDAIASLFNRPNIHEFR